FPFAIGADGTQILKSASAFNPRFFYYACLHIPLESRGYNRHFTLLKEQHLFQPPMPEQEKIAAVLWKVQQSIEIEEKLVAISRELKQAAMRRLLTHGLRRGPQKETDIGPIPRDWRIITLGDLIEVTHGYSFKSSFFRDTGPVVLTPGNFSLDGGLHWGPNT